RERTPDHEDHLGPWQHHGARRLRRAAEASPHCLYNRHDRHGRSRTERSPEENRERAGLPLQSCSSAERSGAQHGARVRSTPVQRHVETAARAHDGGWKAHRSGAGRDSKRTQRETEEAMTAFLQRNLVAWIAQGFIVGCVGSLLPLIFRIRHPRSNLIYYRVLLAACFILPFIQPIQHQIVWIDAVAPQAAVPVTAAAKAAVATAPIQWDRVVLAILGAGLLLRLIWLAGGLWHIGRLTRESSAFSSLPESIRN